LQLWAETVGVRAKQIEKWLKEPFFRDALKQKVQIDLLLDLPAIMEAAVNAAKDGSFNDRKLLLEIAQVYVPKMKSELTGDGGGPIQINIDQVLSMLEARPVPDCEGKATEINNPVPLLSALSSKDQ
jgi:hypothetical protein